jgi:hypothetical protein
MVGKDLHFPRTAGSISSSEARVLMGLGAGKARYGNSPPSGAPFGYQYGGAPPFPGGQMPNVSHTPSRKWYDPEWTGTALALPRTLSILNRWRRFFYRYDPIVGGVIDLHSELPHSNANLLGIEDSYILNHFQAAVEQVDLFNRLPEITREYLKIGEAFPYFRWDDSKGYFSAMILQNQDFIHVDQSRFADDEDRYSMIIDPQLRTLIEQNDPQFKEYKKRLPLEFVRAIMYGEKLPLPFDANDLFVALIKRNSPTDIRGTSIIDRVFKYLIYEDKLLDSQIAIADNFIFPLRIIKIGNEDFTPSPSQLDAFQELLAQKQFDPNFYLLTHNAVTYESHSLASDLMSASNEWERIDKIKLIALGASQNFMTGESTYASAHVGYQTVLARYKALRSYLVSKCLNPFFRTIAIRNEFFKRPLKEINGQYRVSVKREEKERPENLILPELGWEKQLIIREDESFLQFMAGLMGKHSISNTTFFSALGLSYQQELIRSKRDKDLEDRLGINLKTVPSGSAKQQAAGGDEGGSAGDLFSKVFPWRKKKAASSPGGEDKDLQFLWRVANNIHKIEVERYGKDKARQADDIYAELVTAHQRGVSKKEADFFIRDSEPKHHSVIPFFIEKASEKEKPPEYYSSQKLSDLEFKENYQLNYRQSFSTGVIQALKSLDSIVSGISFTKSQVEGCLNTLIDESIKQSKVYINGRSDNIDVEFISNFLKADLTNSLSRIEDSLDTKRNDVRILALTAVVLGTVIHYANEHVEFVRIISPFFDRKMVKLSDIYQGGVSNISTLVSSGIIPTIYPVILDEVDSLRKFGFVSDSDSYGVKISNCPKYFLPVVLSYLKQFREYMEKPPKNIVFGNNIEFLPEFSSFVKEKYQINSEVDGYVVENERRKFADRYSYRVKDTIFVDYRSAEAFSSDYDMLYYLMPFNLEKFCDKKFDEIFQSFMIPEKHLVMAIEGKKLMVVDSDSNLLKVATTKIGRFSIVDYYDTSGYPVIDNRTEFVKSVLRAYFDKKYSLDESILHIFE